MCVYIKKSLFDGSVKILLLLILLAVLMAGLDYKANQDKDDFLQLLAVLGVDFLLSGEEKVYFFFLPFFISTSKKSV